MGYSLTAAKCASTEVDEMALPPSHCLFQFYVADCRLSSELYQRLAETFWCAVIFSIEWQ